MAELSVQLQVLALRSVHWHGCFFLRHIRTNLLDTGRGGRVSRIHEACALMHAWSVSHDVMVHYRSRVSHDVMVHYSRCEEASVSCRYRDIVRGTRRRVDRCPRCVLYAGGRALYSRRVYYVYSRVCERASDAKISVKKHWPLLFATCNKVLDPGRAGAVVQFLRIASCPLQPCTQPDHAPLHQSWRARSSYFDLDRYALSHVTKSCCGQERV